MEVRDCAKFVKVVIEKVDDRNAHRSVKKKKKKKKKMERFDLRRNVGVHSNAIVRFT